MYVPRATYSLSTSFWIGAAELVERDPAPPRDGEHEREQDRRRRVDRHRDRDLIERDLVEQRLDVFDRVDRDADLADLAARLRRVGVVAELRRQIERDREPGHAAREQVAIALVRFGGRREAGVLAHRPVPPAVHRRANPARVRKRAGRRAADRRLGLVVERPQRDAAGVEIAGAHPVRLRRSGPGALCGAEPGRETSRGSVLRRSGHEPLP